MTNTERIAALEAKVAALMKRLRALETAATYPKGKPANFFHDHD